MFSNRFTVVADACSLADVARRDLILTLAEAELFRLRWSDIILEETERAIQHILRDREDAAQRAARSVAAMRKAFPDAMDDFGKTLVADLRCLPDKDDHHVLATAIACRGVMIVTENLKHFPPEALQPYSIEAKSADEFIADTIDLDYSKSIPALKLLRQRLKNPAISAEELVERWRAKGLAATADVVAPHLQNI